MSVQDLVGVMDLAVTLSDFSKDTGHCGKDIILIYYLPVSQRNNGNMTAIEQQTWPS